MPTKTTPSVQDALDEQWETITTGIGEEFDVEARGPLVGNFITSTTKELKDPDTESGTRIQSLHQFAPVDDPDAVVFLWGSYELDAALSNVQQGQLCRISFSGRSQFSSKQGPRQIKHYKVQVKPQ